MFVFLNQTLGRFHRVKRFADLVEASTKTAMLLLKQRSFFYRRFAVLVEDSTKTVNLLTRWNLPSDLMSNVKFELSSVSTLKLTTL